MRLPRALPILVTLALALTAGWSSSFAQIPWEFGKAQLKLNEGVLIDDVNATHGTTTLDALDPLYLVEIPEGSIDEVVLANLNADPRVEWAEYAYVNETPEAVRQMVVAIVGGTVEGFFEQNLYERLRLDDLHAHSEGAGTSIAIIDTGVNTTHPAFQDATFLPGIDYVDNDTDPTDPANGIDDDGDGNIDEGAGHGTMVAGIAHFTAPGAALLPIRVLDDEGFGTTFSVAKGIRYAVEQNVDVINLSLGLPDYCNVLHYEIDRATAADVMVIGAAGNDGAANILFPANLPNVVAVTALDSLDVKADFSNFHQDVFVSAPGLGVLAPFGTDEFAIGAGTSFATPFIAGQAVLIGAIQPKMSKPAIQNVIGNGVIDIYEIPANYPFVDKLGSGRIDGLATWLEVAPVADAPLGGAGHFEINVRSLPGGVFEFSFPARGATRVDIVSVQGRRVFEQVLDRAATTVTWNGRNSAGRRIASGVYFVRAADETSRAVARLVVVR